MEGKVDSSDDVDWMHCNIIGNQSLTPHADSTLIINQYGSNLKPNSPIILGSESQSTVLALPIGEASVHNHVDSPRPRMVDWSKLPPDLIRLISKKLPDLFDFVRFRAICKHWRSSVSASDSRHLPWIFVDNFHSANKMKGNMCFYSCLSGNFYNLHVPAAGASKLLETKSHQYMLSIDEFGTNGFLMSLINPVTNEIIPLPYFELLTWDPVYVSREIVAIHGGSRPGLRRTRSRSSYSTGKRSITGKLAVWHLGDTKWSTMDAPLRALTRAYYRGMYFSFCSYSKSTKVIDVATSKLLAEMPSPVSCRSINIGHYLVESSGELLGVYSLKTEGGVAKQPRRFEIYRLHQENGDFRWVEMRDIGDRVLFIDKAHCLALDAG